MIKFFRKIRQDLIAKEDAKRYVFYAIGEVLLVMIGILLALQVNNWNENRKESQSELKALIDLKEEFTSNKANFQELLALKKNISQLWDTYFDITSNESLPIEERAIMRPRQGALTYKISNNTLNSLLNSGKIDNIENDALKHQLVIWNDVVLAYKEVEQIHLNMAHNRLLDYEVTIKYNENFKKLGIEHPYLSEAAIKKHSIRALNDFTYQNILLENKYWLDLQITNSIGVENTFDSIIKLLEQEISIKQK